MTGKYCYQGSLENVAKVLSTYLPLSRKHAYEVANFVRDKPINRAISELGRVAEGKLAIPYKRFNMDRPHQRGMAAGRFPKKTSIYFIKLLDNLKKNAEALGLDAENMIITHVAVHEGPKVWHYGRFRRRRRRVCNVEIIAKESEESKKEPKVKKASVVEKLGKAIKTIKKEPKADVKEKTKQEAEVK